METDPRKIWRLFAEKYYLFRATPSRMWFEYVLSFLFEIDVRLGADNADAIYDKILAKLQLPEFRCRALYERFNIEAVSTTDSPLDDLAQHMSMRQEGWKVRGTAGISSGQRGGSRL